jgi:hypothetical protein
MHIAVLQAMQARLLMATGALLAATLFPLPAGATQRCSNALADGRFIVQGPLFTALGQPCSVAVIPSGTSLFANPTVIDRARFADRIIILSPPFALAPQRIVIVEQPFPNFSTVLVPSPVLAVRPVPAFALAPTFAVPQSRFTTGTMAPLTTFSNSPPPVGSVIVIRPGTTTVFASRAGTMAGRR